MTEDSETISEKAIDHRLQFLHDHGEIYYVDDWVRITQPNDVAAEVEDTPDDRERNGTTPLQEEEKQPTRG